LACDFGYGQTFLAQLERYQAAGDAVNVIGSAACQRRAEGATLKELASSYNVRQATISRATS
jgi:hypothetical protein